MPDLPASAAMPRPAPSRPLVALGWMVGCILAFAAMMVAAREVQHRHDTFEILAWRSLIGFVIILIAAPLLGRRDRITARHFPRHLLRNSIHFTGQAMWFWALTQITMAQVIALEFTSPLWVVLLSPLFLGERLRALQVFAALIGLAGVMLVARPDFSNLDPAIMAAGGCAIFFAMSVLITKRLTQLGEHVICIMFWLTLMQGTFGFGFALADGQFNLPDASTIPWLLVIGLSGLAAHSCLTMALSVAPASFVGPVDFVRLPIIAALGAWLYAEPLTLGLAMGSALILLANWISLRSQKRAVLQQ